MQSICGHPWDSLGCSGHLSINKLPHWMNKLGEQVCWFFGFFLQTLLTVGFMSCSETVISTRINHETWLHLVKETVLMERHLFPPQGLKHVLKARISWKKSIWRRWKEYVIWSGVGTALIWNCTHYLSRQAYVTTAQLRRLEQCKLKARETEKASKTQVSGKQWPGFAIHW